MDDHNRPHRLLSDEGSGIRQNRCLPMEPAAARGAQGVVARMTPR